MTIFIAKHFESMFVIWLLPLTSINFVINNAFLLKICKSGGHRDETENLSDRYLDPTR